MSSPIERIQNRGEPSAVEARILGITDTEAEEVFEALSADTRRRTYQALFESPASTSELADRLDTSIQNVHHHLSILEDVGLVEPVDTVYSSRGNEMKIYAPASDPLVFVGEKDRRMPVEQSLKNIVAGIALLGIASLIVQFVAERFWQRAVATSSTVGTASYPVGEVTLVEQLAWVLFEVIEPGVFFFVGGLFVAALLLRLPVDR